MMPLEPDPPQNPPVEALPPTPGKKRGRKPGVRNRHHVLRVKFGAQVAPETLATLRILSKESGVSIGRLLDRAVAQMLVGGK